MEKFTKHVEGQYNGQETRVPRRGRFDAEAFYAALDAERRSRRQTWKRVAEEAQVSASTLTRMAQGRRPDVDSPAALVVWSGLSANRFVGDDHGRSEPGTLAENSICVREGPSLDTRGSESP